jgi:hypothetical protein
MILFYGTLKNNCGKFIKYSRNISAIKPLSFLRVGRTSA